MIRKLTLAAALLAPAALAAQDLPTAPYLPLELATKAAQTTLESCAADGYNVSVAIVSRDGATKVHLKADGSGPHTVGSAQGKAFTSASMGVTPLVWPSSLARTRNMTVCATWMTAWLFKAAACRLKLVVHWLAASVLAAHRVATLTKPAPASGWMPSAPNNRTAARSPYGGLHIGQWGSI